MMPETIDAGLLAEYERRLAAVRYEAVGFVEALVVSPRPDEHCRVSSLRVVPAVGVEGEYPGKQWWQGRRVAGRQVSAVSGDVLDALEIPFDVPGDNLIIRGVDLALLAPGEALRVGEAILIVTPTPHRPCAKLARRTSLTKKTAITAGKLRGVLLDAHRPAIVYVGDAAERITLAPASELHAEVGGGGDVGEGGVGGAGGLL